MFLQDKHLSKFCVATLNPIHKICSQIYTSTYNQNVIYYIKFVYNFIKNR